MTVEATRVRTLALVGHAGAGKTSLAEALLHQAKLTTRLGKVEEGQTASDYRDDEIEHKHSINSSVLQIDHKNHSIHLIDTPGYADFIGEVCAALYAVDAVCVVVDATKGVEVGTEKVWRLASEANLPRAVFVSKLSKPGADFDRTLNSIQSCFGKSCVPLEAPGSAPVDLLQDGLEEDLQAYQQSLIEAVAETDDTLLERYLEEGQLPLADVKNQLRADMIAGKVVPIFCGDLLESGAVARFLDAIVELFPAPTDRPPIAEKVMDPEQEPRTRERDPSAPFSAYVFKSIIDPFVGQLTVFRVVSGSLSAHGEFTNFSKGKKERVGEIVYLRGKNTLPVEKIQTGEIGAIAKLKLTETGDSIGAKDPFIFPQPDLPNATLSISVTPKSMEDEDKISQGLHRLSQEDPTFKISRDEQTHDLLVSGLGDMHLNVMVHRLKSQYGVDVTVGTPRVSYRETFTQTVEVQGKFKKQSGGHGQYGDCHVRFEPLERGAGFEFVDEIVGGVIPRQYIPAVEKGIRDAMAKGVLAGYPLEDVRAALFHGSYHAVDSSDLAFQMAGVMALKAAAEKARPVLLEPIMKLEVIIPEEFMGAVNGDLSSRRGRVEGMGTGGAQGTQVIIAEAPLSEILRYSSELKSITGGQGTFEMKFSHYAEVPHKQAEAVIAAAQKAKEERHSK
ncbi:MAG: elongation factor G [Candidatus Omnitrophica bacterium]|nr:elongation factor G [Candidatus Omnitrophota bacterium]